MADWSKEKVNFLVAEATLQNSKLLTDLFVKPTETHQFLISTSCRCKIGMPYSRTLRLNRISSNESNFGKRCNELESWLLERGYS